ncbi:MAG: hypothetical protein ACYS8Y_13300, partial [Planctomycetota bacterium]
MKNKFEEWKEWLFGDDIHAIHRQVRNMIWDSAVFLSIIEARKRVPRDQAGNMQLNETVQAFIDKLFFETQATAIRRLLDKELSEKKRAVFSLYRIIKDMRKHCHLLKRENILAVHGFPYDYEGQR